MSVNWFEVSGQPTLRPAAYNEIHYPPGSQVALTLAVKPINTHPTLGEGQNGKLYGSGPDPFPLLHVIKGKGSATRD